MKRAIILAAVVALCACGDSKAAPQSEDDVFEMWRNAGLEVGAHESLDEHPLGDARCQRGEVAGIETTVCRFETEDAATAAQSAGLKLVGGVTGASLPRGRVLLVVADRDNADPHGKTINSITKTFLGR